MAMNYGPPPLPVNPQTLAAQQMAAQQASQSNGQNGQPPAAPSMSPLQAFVQPQDNSPNGSGPIKILNPFGGPGAPLSLAPPPSYNDALAQALSTSSGQNSLNQNPNQFNAATAGLVGG